MLGLAGADLLGFHTNQYVRHFLSAARRTLTSDECATSLSASAISCRIPRADESVGEAIDLRAVLGEKAAVGANTLKDAVSFAHTAHVAAFPIGIAPERFLEEMRKGETQEAIRRLQEKVMRWPSTDCHALVVLLNEGAVRRCSLAAGACFSALTASTPSRESLTNSSPSKGCSRTAQNTSARCAVSRW